MRERADWRRPRIQAIPSDHPVSLLKLVKTYVAFVLGDMVSRTMLIMITLRMDQYTWK